MTGVSFLESDTAAFLIGFKTRSVFTARHEYLDKVNKEKIYFIVYHIYIAVCSTEGSDKKLLPASLSCFFPLAVTQKIICEALPPL